MIVLQFNVKKKERKKKEMFYGRTLKTFKSGEEGVNRNFAVFTSVFSHCG